MNTQTFEDLLDRHGADISRWPFDLRTDAASWLAVSSEARNLHAAMATVEDVLRASSHTPMDASPGLAFLQEFAATAMRRPQARRSSPLTRPARWGVAVAAALVLGLLVGKIRFDPAEASPDQVVTSALDLPGSIDVD